MLWRRKKLAELYCECRNAANLYLWDGEKQCYISGKERQVSVASQVWMILGEAIEDQAAVNLLRRVETISEAGKNGDAIHVSQLYCGAASCGGEKAWLCRNWKHTGAA